jgi:hypothetical protein
VTATKYRISVRAFHSSWRWTISRDGRVLLVDIAPTLADALARAGAALKPISKEST